MAQFKVTPPETGTDNASLRCWSNRPGASGLQGPLLWGSSLHFHGTSSAERIQCRTTGGGWLLSLDGEIPHSFPSLSFPSPNKSSVPPALFANHVAKAWLLYFLFSFSFFFFCLKENYR